MNLHASPTVSRTPLADRAPHPLLVAVRQDIATMPAPLRGSPVLFDAVKAEVGLETWPTPERTHATFLRAQNFDAWLAWQLNRPLPIVDARPRAVASPPVKKKRR